jgi:hypothetical protein
MTPSDAVIRRVNIQPSAKSSTGSAPSVRVLAKPGEQYAIYVNGGRQVELTVQLPAGIYALQWLNTKTGDIQKRDEIRSTRGENTLRSPTYDEDIAAALRRIP